MSSIAHAQQYNSITHTSCDTRVTTCPTRRKVWTQSQINYFKKILNPALSLLVVGRLFGFDFLEGVL
jgi:hypothetical protein